MIHILLDLIYVINFLTVTYMVFKEKRSANSIIAWTLFLLIAPAIGFFVFILFGRRINKSNMYDVKQEEYKVFEKNIHNSKYVDNAKTCLKEDFDMIHALGMMDYAPYTNNNKIDLFSDGKEFFDELLSSLKLAKDSINIQFYIFKTDEIGTEILNILKAKAEEGVEVRLLYDSVGSRGINKKLLDELIKAGGKVGEFFPSWFKIINLNMNFRNHRKIVVIDKKIGFVGGFNVGDEYLGKNKKFGYWRDTHIKIQGNAVRSLDLRFIADWRYTTKEDLSFKDDLKYIDNTVSEKGNEGIQIISSGPNLSDEYEIKMGYLKMIQKAKNYLYIQSPYLILDGAISDALKLASYSGVDVRIMLPGKGDHPFVYWANLFYSGDLLESGIKIYHYDKNAFLHAKTVVIDDKICSVGTANMDTRSFTLNFEVNAFIYSENISKKQRELFEDDMKKSKELTLEEYNKRSRGVKFKEGFSKLFSALL